MRVEKTNNQASFGMNLRLGETAKANILRIPPEVKNILVKSKEEIAKIEPLDKDVFVQISSGGGDHLDLQLETGLPVDGGFVTRNVSNDMFDDKDIEANIIKTANDLSKEYAKHAEQFDNMFAGVKSLL